MRVAVGPPPNQNGTFIFIEVSSKDDLREVVNQYKGSCPSLPLILYDVSKACHETILKRLSRDIQELVLWFSVDNVPLSLACMACEIKKIPQIIPNEDNCREDLETYKIDDIIRKAPSMYPLVTSVMTSDLPKKERILGIVP